MKIEFLLLTIIIEILICTFGIISILKERKN
jgi:hypothetical protein